MPTSRLFFLISIALFVFIFIAVSSLWWPKYQSFDVSVKSLNEKNQEVVQKEKYFALLNSYDERLGNYTEQLAKIDMAFPTNVEEGLGSFLIFLYGTASQNSILVDNATWNVTDSKDSALIKVKFDGSGLASYEDAKKFVDQLYKNSRLIKLNSITMNKGGDAKTEAGTTASGEAAQTFTFSLVVNFRNMQKTAANTAPSINN